eukprot:4228899-Amphidinium_carterae.1
MVRMEYLIIACGQSLCKQLSDSSPLSLNASSCYLFPYVSQAMPTSLRACSLLDTLSELLLNCCKIAAER